MILLKIGTKKITEDILYFAKLNSLTLSLHSLHDYILFL